MLFDFGSSEPPRNQTKLFDAGPNGVKGCHSLFFAIASRRCCLARAVRRWFLLAWVSSGILHRSDQLVAGTLLCALAELMVSFPTDLTFAVTFSARRQPTLNVLMDNMGLSPDRVNRNDYILPMYLPADQAGTPPIGTFFDHLVPWDEHLNADKRLVLLLHPGVHEEAKLFIEQLQPPLRLCGHRCPHTACSVMVVSLLAMPFTSMLWCLHTSEQRLRDLDERFNRLQGMMNRVLETICAFDAELAGAFGLLLHQRPPNFAGYQRGMGARGRNDPDDHDAPRGHGDDPAEGRGG